MTQLNKHFDDIFYMYDKISYRKKMKKLESTWYLYNWISDVAFKKALWYFKKAIQWYLISIKYWLRFILSPKK